MQGLVDRGRGGILMGHPALAARGAGKPSEHVGNLVFGQAYLFAAVVAEYRLNGPGQAPVIDGAILPQVGQLPGGWPFGMANVCEAALRARLSRMRPRPPGA